MIISFILYLIGALVYGLTSPIRALSDVSLDGNILSSIQTASGYINSFSFILPVGTIFVIIFSLVTIESFVFLYKTIMWVIKRLPTQS